MCNYINETQLINSLTATTSQLKNALTQLCLDVDNNVLNSQFNDFCLSIDEILRNTDFFIEIGDNDRKKFYLSYLIMGYNNISVTSVNYSYKFTPKQYTTNDNVEYNETSPANEFNNLHSIISSIATNFKNNCLYYKQNIELLNYQSLC